MTDSCEKITIAEADRRIAPLIGIAYTIPKTRNKGAVGLWLEKSLGIKASSHCLDCVDGELKTFPLKRVKEDLKAKESIAVTMVRSGFVIQPFEESWVYKKLENTLFIPYLREEDTVTFYKPFLFTKDHPIMDSLKRDYDLLQRNYMADILTGRLGEHLQIRTKGTGNGSITRAFYLRPLFANTVIIL